MTAPVEHRLTGIDVATRTARCAGCGTDVAITRRAGNSWRCKPALRAIQKISESRRSRAKPRRGEQPAAPSTVHTDRSWFHDLLYAPEL